MNKQEMRDDINSIMRWIAYAVYSNAGGRTKFAKAYDKLVAKVLIDYDFNIDNLTESPASKAINIFDVLGDRELQMTLASARSLQKMYSEAMEGAYV